MAFLKKYSLIIFSVFLLQACSKDRSSACLTREGDIVSVERDLEGSFKTLEIYDNAIVTIKQGPESKAIVRGGEKLIDSYITSVEGDRLIIKNNTSCKWTRDLSTPFEVTIIMPEIEKIYFYGYGGLKSDGDLQVQSFYIETVDGLGYIDLDIYGTNLDLIQHTGAVNVNLRGSFDYVFTYSSSMSIIDMSQLIVSEGLYKNVGTGDFRVNTSDILKVQLDLTGDIYYTNDPEIEIRSQIGSGVLIHY